MPKVPEYNEFQVAEAPATQARFAVPQAGVDPGRQALEAGDALTRAGGVVARIAQDVQQQVNETRVADAMNQAVQARMRLTYDPDEGYANLRGKAALERPNGESLQAEYGHKLGRIVSDLDNQLGNDAQKAAFRAQSARLRMDFEGAIGQHTGREFAEFQIGTVQAAQDTGAAQATTGWADPSLVDQGLNAIRRGAEREGQLRGWTAEQVQAATVARTSKVHASIVQAAVQADQLDYAAQHLKRYEAEMGPGARIQADKLVQASKEKAAFLAADQLVRDARDDAASLQKLREQLKDKAFKNLSPEGHAQLEQRILARQQYLSNQEDIRIRRAEAAAARRDRQAESAAKSLQMMLDSGVVPDDATMATLSARVAGTPYAAAVNGMLETADHSAAFAQMTPREQRSLLVEIRSKLNATGSNPTQEKRMTNLQRIADRSETELAEDPLTWAVNRRIVDAKPVNFGSLEEVGALIAERTDAAATIAARTGVPASPLFAFEAQRVADMLKGLQPQAQANAVRKLARTVNPQQMAALGRQIGGKDSVLGLAMFTASGLPPETTELVLRGQDARTAKRIRDDESSRLHHQRITRELDTVPWPTTQARDAAAEAARLVYDGARDKNGGSGGDWQGAIKAVTNGLAEWGPNGSKVPLPQGWDERRFRRALSTMDPKRLEVQAGGPQVTVRGVAMTTEQLARNLGAVTLIPAGPGQYALDSGGALVMNAKGQPLRIKVGD